MKELFAINASEPIKWAEPKPLTREGLIAAAKAHADREERARDMPRTYYVSRGEFDEMVACGIIDKDGRFL